MLRHDPLTLPRTNQTAHDLLAASIDLPGTPGAAYVQKRRIPVQLAVSQRLRHVPDLAGRPAVVTGLYDDLGRLASFHARYLEARRGEDKMLTVGAGGGAIGVLGGWTCDPLILVEGLFDALSLAVCGFPAVATIGRWVPWLPGVAAHRAVWIAFDRGASGEAEVLRYSSCMFASTVHRMLPPERSKDWNTALLNHGPSTVTRWIRAHVSIAK